MDWWSTHWSHTVLSLVPVRGISIFRMITADFLVQIPDVSRKNYPLMIEDWTAGWLITVFDSAIGSKWSVLMLFRLFHFRRHHLHPSQMRHRRKHTAVIASLLLVATWSRQVLFIVAFRSGFIPSSADIILRLNLFSFLYPCIWQKKKNKRGKQSKFYVNTFRFP